MATKEEKKLKRRSLGVITGLRNNYSHSAGEASTASAGETEGVRSAGSLGSLSRAVMGRSKTQGSSLESQAIELSEQVQQHNFSSSGGDEKKDKKEKRDKKDKKKLKRRTTATATSTTDESNTTTACTTTVTTPPSPSSSSSPVQRPLVNGGGGFGTDEAILGQRAQRSQSYSEPCETTRSHSLSQGQRATLDHHAVFARELRQIAAAQRQNAEQIAILRAEVGGLHELEMARQKMAIDDRIKEIDEETACCGAMCCGGLWDCLF